MGEGGEDGVGGVGWEWGEGRSGNLCGVVCVSLFVCVCLYVSFSGILFCHIFSVIMKKKLPHFITSIAVTIKFCQYFHHYQHYTIANIIMITVGTPHHHHKYVTTRTTTTIIIKTSVIIIIDLTTLSQILQPQSASPQLSQHSPSPPQ